MTYKELLDVGYKIENAQIADVSLNMDNHTCLTLDITLAGDGWGVVYGGYKLGHGYLGSDEFIGYAKGMEAIMRIMDTVGVSDLMKMEGKYVRVATKGWGDSVKIIGNITKDKWFDYDTFFRDGKE